RSRCTSRWDWHAPHWLTGEACVQPPSVHTGASFGSPVNVHDALLTHLSYVRPRRLPPALPARAFAFARTGVRLLLTLLTTGGTVWVWLAIAATPAMMVPRVKVTWLSWLMMRKR